MRRLLLTSLLVLGGCAASHQYFEPTEHARGRTLRGFQEAMYELMGPHGQFGEAKVWSHGAYRHDGGTAVQVAMEIHNTSGTPFELHAKDVRLAPVRTDEGVIQSVAPVEDSDYVFAPGSIGEVSYHFVMPPGISPGDMNGFRVLWALRSNEFTYGQATPFVREREYYYYAPHWPSYYYGYPYYPYGFVCDPFDPFCFGSGLSVTVPLQSGYGAYHGHFHAYPRSTVHPQH